MISGGERLGDVGYAGLLQYVEKLAHLATIQPSAGELLGEGIDRHEATADLCGLRLLIDLGVADAVGTVEEDGLLLPRVGDAIRGLYESLPFDLTGAQKRVIREIQADVISGRQMNRLIKGM